ncbi:DUF6207 family protein [Streptomyces sp. NPDC048258]
MKPIDPIHLSEPGLLVLDITGTDEATRARRSGRAGALVSHLRHA